MTCGQGTGPMSLYYPVSGSWPSGHCRAWIPSCEVGLKAIQTLVDNCHIFCATSAPEHLAGRIGCRWRVLWLGFWAGFSCRSLQVTAMKYWDSETMTEGLEESYIFFPYKSEMENQKMLVLSSLQWGVHSLFFSDILSDLRMTVSYKGQGDKLSHVHCRIK